MGQCLGFVAAYFMINQIALFRCTNWSKPHFSSLQQSNMSFVSDQSVLHASVLQKEEANHNFAYHVFIRHSSCSTDNAFAAGSLVQYPL